MPDENTGTTDPGTETGTPPEGQAPPEGTPPVETPPATPEDTLTPEQLRAALTSTRAEAANYRTKLRDTEKKLGEAKTPEEVEAALNELRSANEALERKVLVAEVAAAAKLPSDLAAVLSGSTKEELEAHAKVLAKYVPEDEPGTPPGQLGGGLDPNAQDPDAGLNPRQLAQKHRRRR